MDKLKLGILKTTSIKGLLNPSKMILIW